METTYDVAIAGGGPAGASLALALSGSGLKIALVEPVPLSAPAPPAYDDRGLALSLASIRILGALGIADAVLAGAAPVRRVHVSEEGRFGCVRLDAALLHTDVLGYVVVASELGRALMDGVGAARDVDFLCPARVERAEPGGSSVRLVVAREGRSREIECRLLVAADGASSPLREALGISAAIHDYGQSAVVANVTPRLPHDGTAFERFSPRGPLAVLPLEGGRAVVVCCVPRHESDGALALDDGAFLDMLDRRFGGRLGGFARAGRRRAYPLLRVIPERQVAHRAVLLGNAAHTLHPNGAQGFNLALRDAAALAEQLAKDPGADPGGRGGLEAWAAGRAPDQTRALRFSHGLAELFYNRACARILARSAGMLAAERLPSLKREILRHAAGLSGRQPAWVRGAAPP